jgi:hypothetical protein
MEDRRKRLEDWKKIKEDWPKIKVNPKIKPIHFKDRKPVELIIGKEYYVSFGNNEASLCQLSEIDTVKNTITIETPPRSISKKTYINPDGVHFSPTIYENTLFPDEIGRTPEEAVINQVTS